MSPRKLPPTEDSFLCHIKRACLQLHIWKHALEAGPSHIDLYQFGWSKEQSSGTITLVLMTQGEAAPELLNDIICDFNDICMDNCKCSKFEQTCTAACPCQQIVDETVSCQNPHKLDSVNSSEDNEEEDSDSET